MIRRKPYPSTAGGSKLRLGRVKVVKKRPPRRLATGAEGGLAAGHMDTGDQGRTSDNGTEFPPVKKREIFGWCCFDFANSAFTTVIITVVYAAYFQKVVAGGDSRAEGWWGTALALSQLLVIFAAPLVGAIADVTARKKALLLVTVLVCSLGTMALALVGEGEVWLALGLIVVANVAFSTGENLCGAFLPELSTPETAGRISGYGWSVGYFGGLLSLVLALAVIGGEGGAARVPWTFVITGAFFLLASLPTFLLMRERARPFALAAGESYLHRAWGQLATMRRDLPQHRRLAVFFLAMTVFLSGLTAVIAFAALFAINQIGMTQEQVIGLFIVLQLAGVAGAWGFGLWQDRAGPKPALSGALVLWIVVCAWAGFCRTAGEFYVIGVLAGIAMGALQSAARAVVSTLTPDGRQGEFFGYWGFFAKLAAMVGPLTFGWMISHFGYRAAIIANAGYFLVGLLILLPLSLRPTKA